MTTNNQPGAVDPPPPPYTETDIFSVSGSGGARSRRADSSAAGGDDAASAQSDVVLTPPETPASAYHPNFAGPESDDLLATSSSAQAYFESRPAPLIRLDSEESLIHQVVVGRASSPANFPYQPEWAARDVTVQDWQTFVNHLIPHHAASSSSRTEDRKLRTEGSAEDEHDDDDRSQTLGRDEAGEETEHEPEKERQWRQNATRAVAEWNDGFFAPRGITIFLQLSPPSPAAAAAATSDPHVPGAWDTAFDYSDGQQGAQRGVPGGGGLRFGPFGPFGPFGGPDNNRNSDTGGRRGGGRGRGGFHFGGITVEGDRVSIGNALHVDRNGVRVGGINVPIGGGGPPGHHGNRGFGGMRGFGGPPPPGFSPFGGSGPFGGGRGGGWGGRGGGECGPRGRGRDRGRHHNHNRERSSSSSSSSSSASSRSSASVESVGSLPAYDELRDGQLPATREALRRWLEHPEQPATKEGVREAKARIKAAKSEEKLALSAAAGPSTRTDDAAALRREVKSLMQEWKALKKRQRKAARQAKKERKAARRRARRERREGKREAKRERREARRRGRRGRHEEPAPGMFGPHGLWGPNAPHPWAPGAVPGFGRFPGAPPAPPAPHAPHAPPPPPGFGPPIVGGLFGRGGFFDRFGGAGYPPRGPGGFPDGRRSAPPPGAWPAEQEHGVESGGQNQGSSDRRPSAETGPHRSSGVKYAAAEDLRREIEGKEEELWRLHEEISREDAGRDEKKTGTGDEKVQSESARRAREVESEIENLGRALERVRMEADAEFARELAELELAMG